jgi:hypothetical protein
MNRIFVKRVGITAVLLGAIGLAVAAPAEARPSVPRPRGFRLFAAPILGMEVNRVYCGLRAIGETCVDVTNSPVLGGGSWPRGSGDAYIFNSGLQIAGIIPASAGFAWAGDTVGSWFMDPRGDQQSGEQITDIFSSLNASDLDNWPNAAYVRDTSLFDVSLLGRRSISQQDIWWRYWDGNPNQTTGRRHPAGILVEQRGMGWNFPSGNEDLIYFIYRFINITASNASVYAGLADAGYEPGDIAEIAALGARFQQLNEAKFGIQIPDGGYPINNTFAAFFMDPDVGDFLTNYSTAILPFSTGVAYVGDWEEETWQYPSNIFSPPFAAAPGYVGVKYLRSPINPATGDEFGISIFSNTTNGAPFPDAVGIQQVYRYLSGTVSPALGDNSCTVTNPQARRLCALVQTQADTRFFQSSGPFNLAPGQQALIVVAYMFAAPVAAEVAPFIGGNMPPGIPPSGRGIRDGTEAVRNVERIAGWISHSDLNLDGEISQNEVTVVDRSLLSKALVAQTVFNNRFLLPFAPEAPNFYAVPGDRQVTIVWQASASEVTGDPYFAVASVPTLPPEQGGGPNPLFDPNYREHDVEGYRIWRGRTPSQMQVIAQFDYDTTSFRDYNGTVFNTDYGTQCAPELALITTCPAFPNAVPIVAQLGVQPGLVQIPPGGRVVAGGNVVITQADTAVSGGGARCGGAQCPALTDNGVPFAFVDNTVRNGFRYFYAVTAFDVNSVKSTGVGNTSLESPLVTRSVTPRLPSGQEVGGTLGTPQFVGANGDVLAPIPMPTLNPATGIFSGPMPHANIDLGFAAFVPQIVTDGALNLTVDSVVPTGFLAEGNIGHGVRGTYFVTVQGSGAPLQLALPISLDFYDEVHSTGTAFPATAASTARSSRFGGDSTYSLYGSVSLGAPGPWLLTSWGRASINQFPANSDYNGPRWWAGAANENTADPNGSHCPGSPGGCVQADLSRTAGSLPGVTTLFHPHSYNTIPNVPARNMEAVTALLVRAADFRVHWGAGGVVDSVVDVTHQIRVPFSTRLRASWGILNATSFAGVTASADGNNGLLTWSDTYCVDPVPALINQCGGAGATRAVFENQATLTPIAATSSSYANTATLTATGNGFIFYLNGHFFLMQMAALPTAGTVWNARFYSGVITGSAAGGDFAFSSRPRPPAAPGMRVQIAYSGTSFDPGTTTASSLERIHTVPDPYYVTNALEITSTTKVLRFVNLPSQAIIRIYSTSGVLVNIVSHNDPTGGGEAAWNLRNRNNQFVASGVYFYHVETPDGREKIGRFTVVNYAQ